MKTFSHHALFVCICKEENGIYRGLSRVRLQTPKKRRFSANFQSAAVNTISQINYFTSKIHTRLFMQTKRHRTLFVMLLVYGIIFVWYTLMYLVLHFFFFIKIKNFIKIKVSPLNLRFLLLLLVAFSIRTLRFALFGSIILFFFWILFALGFFNLILFSLLKNESKPWSVWVSYFLHLSMYNIHCIYDTMYQLKDHFQWFNTYSELITAFRYTVSHCQCVVHTLSMCITHTPCIKHDVYQSIMLLIYLTYDY